VSLRCAYRNDTPGDAVARWNFGRLGHGMWPASRSAMLLFALYLVFTVGGLVVLVLDVRRDARRWRGRHEALARTVGGSGTRELHAEEGRRHGVLRG
jgi:hypothetical protein